MSRFYSRDDFLEKLNARLVFRNLGGGRKSILNRPVSELGPGAQLTFPLDSKQEQLHWTIDEVDFVLEGPCPVFECNRPLRKIERFPMGTCMRHVDEPEDAPERSWLHVSLESKRLKDTKHLVVYAECCGDSGYPTKYRELLRRLFPHITWTFVGIPNMHECSYQYPCRIATSFVEAGLMKIE